MMVPTQERVDELEAEMQVAEQTLRKARDMRESERAQLVSAAKERIEREVNIKHAEKIQALCNAAVAAKLTFERAKESLALSGKTARLPLGTRMVQWEHVRNRENWSKWTLVATKRRGIVEVLQVGSPLPRNRAHGLPKIGDVIIRVLKADGARSINCLKLDSWDGINRWFPEGHQPTTKEIGDGTTAF